MTGVTAPPPTSDPVRQPRQSALFDALRYPLRTPALVTNLLYCAGRVVASLLPVFGPLLHALLTLGVYKYAFECLVTSAQGRTQPPEVIAGDDLGTHRRHLLLQALWLLVLVVATHFVERDTALLLIAAVALALPGALLALCVAQNLIAALNPISWWNVASRLGATYFALAFASFGVLLLQASARDLLQDVEPRLLAIVAFHALSQHLVIALFRALGSTLHLHAAALQYDAGNEVRPPIERDRVQAARAQSRADALALTEPSARADAIGALLSDGADHDLHREYRRALRGLGRRDALQSHASTHVCELLTLGQTRAALALSNEALDDSSDFTLPDAAAIQALMDTGERAGLLRQVALVAANYTEAFPKRFDGLPLALRAAILYADRLADPARARQLLERGSALAGEGAERDEFLRLRQRLDAGLPLHGTAFVAPVVHD